MSGKHQPPKTLISGHRHNRYSEPKSLPEDVHRRRSIRTSDVVGGSPSEIDSNTYYRPAG